MFIQVNSQKWEAAEVETGAAAEAPVKAKSPPETVKMTDGTSVDFAGNKKMIKSAVFTDASQSAVDHIRFDFRNGEVRQIKLNPALLARFAAHGAEQKYGDETAGEKDVDDMVLAIDALDERLQKGEWTVAREGGGMSGTSVLIKALVEYGGKSLEEVKAFLKDKDSKTKAALRTSVRPNSKGETMQGIVTRIEAEKAAKGSKVDTDALLASF